MADEKKTPKLAVKKSDAEKLPVHNVSQNNTPAELNTGDTDKDVGVRAEGAVDMVVNRTGQLPADVNALTAELHDQVLTEAKAETTIQKAVAGDVRDALTLERLDHARTLQHALGLSTVSSSNPEEARKLAEERHAKLKKATRDTTKDNVHNSKPSNWIVTASDDSGIKAYNKITGKEYDGPADGLMKAASEEKADA